MGIIRQQTIKGSIVSYLGAILGFINVGILFPRILTTEEIGLINWLIPLSLFISQIATLGANGMTSKLFPYFRDENKNHHGFLSILFLVGIAGFILALIVFFVFKPYAVELYSKQSPLHLNFLVYLIPLVFFSLYFNLLDGYNRVMYDAVLGTFFRDVVFKLFNLAFIILFWFDALSFSGFILLYTSAFCLPTVLLFLLLWKRGQISFKLELNFIGKDLRRSMISVSFFGILNGLGDRLANTIDRLMIVDFIGLGANGIYSITSYFGILISMPSRSLKRITSTVIAEAWKRNDLDTIRQVYAKSGLHQFVLACLLFIGVWVNIDSIFQIITSKYLPGKYVIFLIGLHHVLHMLDGVSGTVIMSSPRYRTLTWFVLIYGAMVTVSNYLVIPVWGIVGAAAASLLSGFLFHFMKFLFLFSQYKFQPFNYKYLLVIAIAFFAYYSGYFLPELDWFVLDIFVRSSIVAFVYMALTLLLKISHDLNYQAGNFWRKYMLPILFR